MNNLQNQLEKIREIMVDTSNNNGVELVDEALGSANLLVDFTYRLYENSQKLSVLVNRPRPFPTNADAVGAMKALAVAEKLQKEGEEHGF